MRNALAVLGASASLACASAPASVELRAEVEPSRFEDDWPGALAQAKARGVPVVVDAWAPW